MLRRRSGRYEWVVGRPSAAQQVPPETREVHARYERMNHEAVDLPKLSRIHGETEINTPTR